MRRPKLRMSGPNRSTNGSNASLRPAISASASARSSGSRPVAGGVMPESYHLVTPPPAARLTFSGLADSRASQDPHHRTGPRERRLHQVQAHESGEQEPGRMDEISQRHAGQDKGTGDQTECFIQA